MTTRTRGALALSLLPLWTGWGCQGNQRPPKDTLVVLIEATVEDLDPRFAASGYAIKVSRLVAAPLVSLNTRDARPKLELAERIEHPDPRTYVVTLRRGARFSSGAPVRAADVLATFQSMRDDRATSPYHRAFSRIVRLEALSPRRVRFVLRRPHAPFVGDLDMGILPARLLSGVGPAGRIPDRRLLGAGPLRIVRRTPSRIVLERNPYYFGTPPALRRYVIKTVEDDNSRLLSLVSGGADLTQNTIQPLLLPVLRRSPRLRILSSPGLSTTYLALNLRDPRLRDRRVRMALALAIDRRRILRAKFRGRASLAATILPPHHWAQDGPLAPIPHDPARAEQLLDAAGFPRRAGGVRMRLAYKTSSNRFRVAIARVIARQLGRVGVRVSVRALEWGVFFSDLKKGSFQIASLQMTELAEPDYYYFFFHSSMRTSPAKPNAGGNRFGYASPEVDRWLEQGRRAQGRAARRRFYVAVQRRLARDLPVIPLWHEDNVVVARRLVRGYRPLPNARFDPLLRVTKRK